jgi:hypothetical protein
MIRIIEYYRKKLLLLLSQNLKSSPRLELITFLGFVTSVPVIFTSKQLRSRRRSSIVLNFQDTETSLAGFRIQDTS